MRHCPHVSGAANPESPGRGQLLPKHHLCSHPAATLAGNTQSSWRDSSKPPAVPGDAKSSRRDDAETPALARSGKSSQRGDTELSALARSGESCGEDSAEPLATARSGESSQQDDAEQPALAGREESGCGGAAERPPTQEPEGSAVSAQGAAGETGAPHPSLGFLCQPAWGTNPRAHRAHPPKGTRAGGAGVSGDMGDAAGLCQCGPSSGELGLEAQAWVPHGFSLRTQPRCECCVREVCGAPRCAWCTPPCCGSAGGALFGGDGRSSCLRQLPASVSLHRQKP